MCRRNFIYDNDRFEDPEDEDPSGEYLDYGAVGEEDYSLSQDENDMRPPAKNVKNHYHM